MALDIKNWGFQLKRAGGGSRDKNTQKNWKMKTLTVDQAVDRFVGAGSLKGPRASVFFSLFSGIPRRPFIFPPSGISLGYSLDRFQVLECSLTRFEARVSSLDGFGLRILTGSSLFARHLLIFSPFPRAEGFLGLVFSLCLLASVLQAYFHFWILDGSSKGDGYFQSSGQAPC